MNSRFVPVGIAEPSLAALPAAPRAAIVTASYAPDFERCRLLCETVDRHVSGMTHHYILVEHRDVALFRTLESTNRSVVDERDLLPAWLKPFGDPLSLFRKRVWLSTRAKPLRGWHVQQLRRIAIAAHTDANVLVYCDSDVAFVKPFDCASFWHGGKARLFRRESGLPQFGDHPTWSRNAGSALGIASPPVSPHDYISTLIAWRTDAVIAMCARMEAVHGKSWVEVVGSARKFSECLIYGRFADEILEGAGHFPSALEFCRVHWTGSSLTDADFRDFVAGMEDHQVAIGMQSFIGTDIGSIRRMISEF